MTKFDVSARMKVREGLLDGFKKQAAECVRVTREKDTRTLRYDWFLSEDETECEIREAYVDADGFLEHRAHVGEALDKLFAEFADGHNVTVYGDASPELVEFANSNMPPGSVLSGIGSSRDSSLCRLRLADPRIVSRLIGGSDERTRSQRTHEGQGRAVGRPGGTGHQVHRSDERTRHQDAALRLVSQPRWHAVRDP